MWCGYSGSPPGTYGWTLSGLSDLYDSFNDAANQLFDTSDKKIKSIYTIKKLDMGWAKNEETGKYEFNTKKIDLNVSEQNKTNGNDTSVGTIVTQPFSGSTGQQSSINFWTTNAGNNSYALYSVNSTSKQSTANTEISTDTRNTTYYILLEKK